MAHQKYYYRFDVSSELGLQFRKFMKNYQKAERAADSFAARLGAKTFYPSTDSLAGGVSCVGFPDGKQVDERLWRSLGKDGDGIEQYEPRVRRINGVFMLPRRNFRPSHTATRIYSNRLFHLRDVIGMHTLEEWASIAGVEMTADRNAVTGEIADKLKDAVFCKYIDLEYDGEVPAAPPTYPKRKLPHYIRETVRIEHDRILLPVVSFSSLFALLHADLTGGDQSANIGRFERLVMPVMFEWLGYYYIDSRYPCVHNDIQAMAHEDFVSKQIDFEQFLREQKRMEKDNIVS